MNKAYSRIIWQNQPSTATTLGATNLNRMDGAINTIDDRVVAMDTSKADAATVNQLVKSIAFNPSDGKFTITLQNGTTTVIDTAMEKIVTNFSYNATTQKIDLTLADGSTQSIDISDFVTNVDFATSNTIQFSVDGNGKTKAEVINGSITAEKLQPDYLADVTVQAQTATLQANKAQRYAVGGVEAGDITDNAKYYKEQAEYFAGQAEAIVGIGIANETTPGLAKGGGDVSFSADGSMNVDKADNATVEFTEAAEDAELTTGSTLAVLMGLIKKKFTTLVTAMAGKIGTDKIANNDITTEEGFVWDARRGKQIRDDVNALNNNLAYTFENVSNAEYLASNVMFCKSGTIKQIYYANNFIKNVANGQSIVLGTIPEAYRPATTRNILITMRGYGTDIVFAQLTLFKEGNFAIQPYYGSISSGSWYFIHATYM